MFDTQASNLSKMILDGKSKDSLHISFEPMFARKKDIKKLKHGDLFFIKDSMPLVYIMHKNQIVGQARLGMHQESVAVIIEANEHMPKNRTKEKSQIKLWPKFALLKDEDFRVGNIVPLAHDGHTNIILYHKSNKIAIANLLQNKRGYVLEIKETF